MEEMLIIENVEAGSPAEKAGIQPGYTLWAYQGLSLSSPARLMALEENNFDDKNVSLQVEWQGQRFELDFPPGKLGIEARPNLTGDTLSAFESGRAKFQAGQYVETARHWEEAAHLAQENPHAVWLHMKVGEAWERQADWNASYNAYFMAHKLLRGSQDSTAKSLLWRTMGKCLQSQGRFVFAKNWHKLALQADKQAKRLLWVARNNHHLGNCAYGRDLLDEAQNYYHKALRILKPFAPNSSEAAAGLDNLGLIATDRGDLALAEKHHNCSLQIRERINANPLLIAASLNNIGLIHWQRGDLNQATDYDTRALAIREEHNPDSLDVAMSWNNLGLVAWKLGNSVLAERYFEDSYRIRQEQSPDSKDTAISLNNWGLVAFDQEDWKNAKNCFLLALHILERNFSAKLTAAITLNNLGELAQVCGDLNQATDYHTRALAIREEHNPDSLDVASSLSNLGGLAISHKDWTVAQNYLTRAHHIFERIAPDSMDHSDTLELRGHLAWKQEQFQASVDHFQRAIDIIEQQRSKIPTLEARALLRARHTGKYAGLIQAYHALDSIEDAFYTLERSRARSLLELLTERSLDFTADASLELLLQQQALDRHLTDAYFQLGHLSPQTDGPQIEGLYSTLKSLDHQQQELTAQIRAASPRYASLQYPQPLHFKEVQAALDPCTLLLSYFVDEEQTFLFALTAACSKPRCVILPISQTALQNNVNALLDAIQNKDNHLDYAQQAIEKGRQLYADLIRPIRDMADSAKRLLLCPDGPLHTLPFAALVMNSREQPQYLGSAKPLHTILSATLYVQMRRQGEKEAAGSPKRNSERSSQARPSLRLLALGGPITPGQAPLPHSRKEVEFLKQLFGKAATIRLGGKANKTVVLSESGKFDLLHFACHAKFDAEHPLSSGLILSPPPIVSGQALSTGDEWLRAWEIFQKLRLKKAELIVLSACESGLGKEIGGEGLIGLTRAFQYAGAKSLVVSLWKISDESAFYFMQAFYTALKTGAGKDEALQQGIQALQADPRWNDPWHWGAFVLIGDRNSIFAQE